MEKNADDLLHHSFVANDASLELWLYPMLSYSVYRCTDILSKSYFLFHQPSAEAISCFKKSKKNVKILLRQTVMNVPL